MDTYVNYESLIDTIPISEQLDQQQLTTEVQVDRQSFEIVKWKKQDVIEWIKYHNIQYECIGDKKIRINFLTAQYNIDVDIEIQDKMHYHTNDFGLTEEDYSGDNQQYENQFQQVQKGNPSIKSIENYCYIVISMEATKELQKEGDIDTVACVVNLYNHKFNSPRLYVKQVPQQNNEQKRYKVFLSQNYLIDKDNQLSQQQFYELIQEMSFMSKVQLCTKSLFQSIQQSKKVNNNKEISIEEIIIKYIENIKRDIKKFINQKSKKIEEFNSMLEELQESEQE